MNPVLVALVVSIPALVATVVVMVLLVRINRKVDAVMGEVRTFNESTIGGLANAIETLRVETKQSTGKPLTPKEQRHIDAEDGGSL